SDHHVNRIEYLESADNGGDNYKENRRIKQRHSKLHEYTDRPCSVYFSCCMLASVDCLHTCEKNDHIIAHCHPKSYDHDHKKSCLRICEPVMAFASQSFYGTV